MNDIDKQVQQDKNKRNIKWVLVIIIILLLTLIGGTYAFMGDAISNIGLAGKMGKVNLSLDVTKVLPSTEKVDDVFVVNFSNLADSLNNGCMDEDGQFALCQVYKINLANNSGSLNTNVKGSLSFNNATTPNLSWIYLGNSYNSSNIYTSAMLGNSFNSSSSTFTSFVDEYLLTAGTSVDFYVVVWINELDEYQTDEGSYSGKVRFEDANGNGVTATFD